MGLRCENGFQWLWRFEMKRKPIFVAFLPRSASFNEVQRMRESLLCHLNGEYHIVVVKSGYKTKFQVFSDKEIKPIQLKKFKEFVLCK